jgi:ABC-type transporter MlaC component
MIRIAALLLLAILSLAAATPTQAQRITPEQNARQSRKEIKRHQKLLKKANKKQAKAMKKYAKQQRNATRKANKNLNRRRTG